MNSQQRDRLPFLRLARTLAPGERRPRRSGFGGGRSHDDLPQHGRELKRTADGVTMRHLQRQKVLGIDPRLIMVFDLNASLGVDDFRRAGLKVVDFSDKRLVVAFSDDPELAAFKERLDAFTGGIPAGQTSEPYAQFFDAIDGMRQIEPEDKVTSALQAAIDDAEDADELRMDVECWHPDNPDPANSWARDTRRGIESAGGNVHDTLINNSVGLILMRAYIPAGRVMEVAELDVISRMDVLPRPALSKPQLHSTSADMLPTVLAPAERSPVVGLVDSGVASGHPLLRRAILASDAIGTGIDEDQDEHGHGTMVASMLLYGDVQKEIASGSPMQPICRVVSARVLNADNDFPVYDLWERDIQDAVKWCADHGARIVNLSIGDGRSPFSPPRQMKAAAIVDNLAREHGLVMVIAAGNSRPADYLSKIDETALHGYPSALLDDDATGLLDPATSMLGLTVGGLTDAAAAGAFSSRETLRRQPMGKPGWPSPITRRGPGPNEALKPELAAFSGTMGIEDGTIISKDAELGVIGARAHTGRLLDWDVGTSYAAPLVSRVAAAVVARFPDFTAELIRALVLISTERLPFADDLQGTEAEKRKAALALVGHGRPSIQRAIEPTEHRPILVAEARMRINAVHIYEIPIPSSFMKSGGRRGLDVALAHSPRTRVQRLDYMASKMEFHVVKGLPLDDVARIFSKIGEDDVPKPSALGSKYIKLQPSATVRSRGANQLGRKVFHHRLDETTSSQMFLVVRNVNSWDDDSAEQSYALAVALWRDEQQPELHADLAQRLEAVVELPLEIEAEV